MKVRHVGTAAVAAAVLLTATALQAGAAGTTWRIQATPTASGQSGVVLAAVSCASTTHCEAAGSYGNSMVTETYDAGRWGTVRRLSAPGSSRHALAGIACPTASDCVAVGTSTPSSTDEAFVEHESGDVWSPTTLRTSAGKVVDGSLEAVSCSAPDACTAVGYRASSGSAIVERWDGHTWTAQTPADAGTALLQAVSCPTAGSCYATGSVQTAQDTFLPLVEHWNGSAWTRQSAPTQAGADTNALQGVSCSAATSCIAVGSWSPSSAASGVHVLIDRLDGTTWVRQTTPDPALQTAGLAAISCAGPDDCSAVGSNGPNMAFKVLAEHWNGKAWAVQTSADEGAYSELGSVSCQATVCRAVGGDGPSTPGPSRPLAETD